MRWQYLPRKILFQSLLSSTTTIMIRVEDDYYIAPCMGEIKENRSCLLLRSHSVLLMNFIYKISNALFVFFQCKPKTNNVRCLVFSLMLVILIVYFFPFFMWFAKGQLISKWLFGILEFFQKTNKRIWHSTVRPKRTNSFVHFLEE